ncbi:MAG TPA: MMPL family transporter [Acidimicrobiales bacterium]|nr:MMPL family transporter [Acidimicrobiales bacterium]
MTTTPQMERPRLLLAKAQDTPTENTGILGRLGFWSVRNHRRVFIGWLIAIVLLGIFAPGVEKALSGAGWQADGSQSVAERTLAMKYFGGQASSSIQVIVTSATPITNAATQKIITEAEATLRSDHRIGKIIAPTPGYTISKDQRTAVILGGANADTNTMVRAADDLKGKLAALSTSQVRVVATGSSVLWSDFNNANRSAMMKSELFSWPVTMAILVIAFGSLIAAGLPLLLTMVGLLSAAGMLDLLTKVTPISIWAMNFALMFALALGIDYALFIVVRFRGAHFGRGRDVAHSVAETMDTAGKAVLFSGITVLISLSSVMIVPSPAFRSMAGGIMLAVAFVLAATLTLLPAVLGKLDNRVDSFALPWVHQGEHRSARFARWGELLWRHPKIFGALALVALVALSLPIFGLKTAMPSIKVVPVNASSRIGYSEAQSAFGIGAPGQLQVIAPNTEAAQVTAVLTADRTIAAITPAQPAIGNSSLVMISATPTVDPSNPLLGTAIAKIRSQLPTGAVLGGAPAENYDLQQALAKKTPLVIGMVLVLGFLLLLFVLQAVLIAALGVLTSLLATAGSFGVARLVFQNGLGHRLLGLSPQGFLDAWDPVFFFAMIFAISMDYTVFLLSSTKEHFERSGDPKDAMVNGLAHSGRVIFSAAAVMIAVFFTFSLSGPLPPKEMGIILGVAVFLDAFFVRLLLLPVLLRLTGMAAWWAPRWLLNILPRISFAHGE